VKITLQTKNLQCSQHCTLLFYSLKILTDIELSMLYNLCINLKTSKRDFVVIHEGKIFEFAKKPSSRLLFLQFCAIRKKLSLLHKSLRVAS